MIDRTNRNKGTQRGKGKKGTMETEIRNEKRRLELFKSQLNKRRRDKKEVIK